MSRGLIARLVGPVVALLLLPAPALATAPSPGEAVLAVMTVNLKHKDRPAELLAVAEHLRRDTTRIPDFIACQEVVFGRDDEKAPHTAAVLANALGYHVRGTKRTSDSEGLAIVSRFPFAHYEERHLKAQTSRLLLGFRRVSVMGEFLVPGVGRVRVVNVHFTNWGFEDHVRRKQIAETLAWVDERQRNVPAAVTFLAGDFNAEADDDEMRQLHAWGRAQGRRLAFSNFNGSEPSKGSVGDYDDSRIDLVFVAPATGRPVRLEREELLWRKGLTRADGRRFHLSDHLPVYHLYRLGEVEATAGAE